MITLPDGISDPAIIKNGQNCLVVEVSVARAMEKAKQIRFIAHSFRKFSNGPRRIHAKVPTYAARKSGEAKASAMKHHRLMHIDRMVLNILKGHFPVKHFDGSFLAKDGVVCVSAGLPGNNRRHKLNYPPPENR